ncbi:ABC-2 transporter permease [Clostridium minihomine]|uniref:ABC-2 transporter permease n=1 Tax=Clostridium minihomine TaxID=2045012 RepID=UPI000C778FB2|nr:ABC-2 transporter permease [Clostridium minihomine]
MKGLLYKDLMNSKGPLIGTFFYFLVFAIFAIPKHADGRSLPGTLFSVFLFYSSLALAHNSFQQDEQNKWNVYALSLPIDKKLLIQSKYLFLTAYLLLGHALALGLTAIQPSIGSEILLVQIMLIARTFLFLSMFLPLIYRFGSRNATVLIVCTFFALGLLKLAINDSEILNLLTQNQQTIVFYCWCAGCVILYCASYHFSYKMLEKGDVH